MCEFYCPRCGEDVERLHEGYCLDCCERGQAELGAHNARFDQWEAMSDAERDTAIREALR